jgi:competence ComEA-like helix-hairpin-helix protein
MQSYNAKLGAQPGRCSHRGEAIVAPLCMLVLALSFLPSPHGLADAAGLEDRAQPHTGKSSSDRDREKDQLPEPLDLNAAGEEELAKLPGIGPELARRIVAFRRKHGPFRRVEDLLAIRGLGHKKWREIRSRLVVGPKSGGGDDGDEEDRKQETGSRE